MLRVFLRLLCDMPFYAVREGRCPGVYMSWTECEAQVKGYSGAKYKKFGCQEDAEEFVCSSSAGSSCNHLKPNIPKFKAKESSTEHHVLSQYKKKRNLKLLIDLPSCNKHEVVSRKEFPSAPVVYTDGACLNNGKPNASAGIGVYWAPYHPMNVSEKLNIERPTNQKAELWAAIRALRDASYVDLPALELRTDSIYTIKAVTEWIEKWKVGDNWKNSKGEKVSNMDEIKELDSLCSQIAVTWVHVPGHEGVYGNEQADKFAREGAMR